MSVWRNNRIVMALCVMFTLTALNLPTLAYPPDPENAALLYYQSFITYERAKGTLGPKVQDVAEGKIAPDKEVKDYLDRCRGAIELAVVASELPQCDWGLRYSQGFDILLTHLAQIRSLARNLITDARIQASEDNHELALERCITTLKISRHVGDETLVSFLVGTAVERMAGSCIGDLLGQKRADSESLKSIKDELAGLAKRAPSAENSFDIERQMVIDQIKMEKIGDLMRSLDPEKSEEEVLKEVRKFGGEEFLKKIRDYYSSYMKSLMSILRSRKSYAEIHRQLAELAKKPEKEQEKNPEVMLTAALTPGVSKIYGNMIRGRTQANALRAAVDIYISRGKTGQLPNALPSGLPKDLFSGKDFEYKKTKAGFLLRCRSKDLDKDKIQEYDFKVPK